MANPYFNAVYYLTQNPDVFAAGYTVDTAWDHYVQYGANEAFASGGTVRAPNAWFDAQYYLTTYSDLIANGVTPATALDHFLNYGSKIAEDRAPNATVAANPITSASLLAYALGNADLQTAFGIADDATELTEAQENALINHFYAYGYSENRPDAPTTINDNPGSTFTLTTGVDEFTGTVGNDTFRAVVADSLQSFDILDGGAGSDVLNIAADGLVDEASPVISNIERINNASTETLDLTNVTGANQVWSSDAGKYTGASTDTIFGADIAADKTVTIDYAGTLSKASVSIAVDANAEATKATFELTDAANITTVNVLAASVGTLVLDADLDALTTINVSGEGELVFDSATAMEATLKTFDASSNSGGVTVNLSDADALVSATGGSGADDFTVLADALTADATSIDMGAGNDDLSVEIDASNALSITLGAGADDLILTVDAAGNVVSVADNAALLESVITVVDFAAGEDVLNVVDVLALGAGAKAAQNSVNSAVTDAIDNDAEDLLDIVTAIYAAQSGGVDILADGGYALFNYEGNAYILADEGDGAFATGDTLIQLSGISYADLTADNFVTA